MEATEVLLVVSRHPELFVKSVIYSAMLDTSLSLCIGFVSMYRGEIRGDVQDWLESRLLSSPVHRVLMTEDLQRLLVSYL